MSGRGTRNVFISYARKDGETFATNLRRRLEEEAPDLGIVWQDRARLEGGVGWWKQITDAIDACEFMALVMTPAAMESPIVRKEWRYARQQGLCVYPIMAARGLNFGALPRWMSKAHFFDLEKEWESFLAHMRRGCQAARVPFMVPDLPDHFVPRPAEFGQLKGLLLDPSRENPVAITTALRGAGGFGKTTLAAALCHDEDIGTAFDDGVLWVTLGESPNILANLTTLYAALTGEHPGFANEEDAAYHLSRRLEDRNCLIVIDDVWNAAHLRPFLQGGKGCARLITTRLHDVAPEGRPVLVDQMTPAESVALLSGPASEATPAGRLARRLGYWPLILDLAHAALRLHIARGASFEQALGYLHRALDEQGVTAFDHRNPIERNQAVGRCVGVSLRLLSVEEQQCYTELAIFPEDADIPVAAVAVLWSRTEFRTQSLLEALHDLSLLKFDPQRGTLRLHDVFRAWLAEQLPNPVALHQRLLDNWDRIQPAAYAWRWRAWHMLRAGRQAELRALLFDCNWLQPKLQATDSSALIADYDCLPDDPGLRHVQDAIRLSAHILAQDPGQLPSQLLGRVGHAAGLVLPAAGTPWLHPLSSSLTRPGGPLRLTLHGHMGRVLGVAVSPDGRRAMSASFDKTLKVWDLEDGRELLTLRGHTGSIWAVAVTADGRRAVSASGDQTLKVWNLEEGRELHTLRGHKGSIWGVAVSADGRRAISACRDRTLKVWDLEDGRELHTLRGHVGSVWAVAVTADGRRAVSASGDQTLKVWNLEDGRELHTLRGHKGSIWGVAVSADGRRAVSASEDRTLKVWDLESAQELHTLRGHTDTVGAVAVSPDGRRAVSVSDDRTLKVWDIQEGRETRTLRGHTGKIWDVAVSANGRRAVTASGDKTLKVWDLEEGCELRRLPGHTGAVLGTAVSADGRWAVSASGDRTLKLWDLEGVQELHTLRGHTGWVTGVAVGADGRLAVSASADKTLKVWDLERAQELHTLRGHTGAVLGVVVSADGRRVVSGCGGRTLKVWDPQEGRELHTLRGHTRPILGVAVSADGRRAVSASGDRTLKLWDPEKGRELRTLRGHARAVNSVAMSADGCRAVSVSGDQTLRVWDLETGRELDTLRGHTRTVRGVALSADGRRAVSASLDQTLKVWDLERGRSIATFNADGPLTCCAMTPGGLTIVTGDETGVVHFLRLELPHPDR